MEGENLLLITDKVNYKRFHFWCCKLKLDSLITMLIAPDFFFHNLYSKRGLRVDMTPFIMSQAQQHNQITKNVNFSNSINLISAWHFIIKSANPLVSLEKWLLHIHCDRGKQAANVYCVKLAIIITLALGLHILLFVKFLQLDIFLQTM